MNELDLRYSIVADLLRTGTPPDKAIKEAAKIYAFVMGGKPVVKRGK